MSKETYQQIKRISGEELRELLSDLDNVIDLGTITLMGDSSFILQIIRFIFIAVV
tara:strand:+ start:241 stop:405 length:165 start_codon:yes stop_codon:yes gene_type:complete